MGKRGKERGEKASLRERGRSDGVKVTGGGKGQSPGHTREVGLYKVGDVSLSLPTKLLHSLNGKVGLDSDEEMH